MGMSHPICRAHLAASKGGSSIPPFFPFTAVRSLPPSLARSLLLKARLALAGARDPLTVEDDRKQSLNNLGYLYETYHPFSFSLYIWDEIIYFDFISLHRALPIKFPENQL